MTEPSTEPAAAPLEAGLHPLPPGWLAAVVTHLARPVPAGAAMPAFPDGFAPRRATGLTVPAYRALFRRVGEDWLWVSRLVMADAALAAILSDPAVEVWTLARDGEDLALLELDFRVPGACEIAFLGLAPGRTGQGLGGALMALAFARAAARGAGRIRLHTCSHDHPGAPGFYRAQGFEAFALAVEVMPDPRSTGLIRPDAAPHVPLIPG